MKTIELKATARSEKGKGANRRLRQGGEIPIILYGLKEEPNMLSINDLDLLHAASEAGDESVMFRIKAEGADFSEQLAMIRDVQRDPVTEKILHLDMIRIDINKPIDVEVTIHGHGTPDGVREGGILEQVLWSLHIRCLPNLVPSYYEVDISGIGFGDAMHVSEIEIGEGIELLTDPEEVLFQVNIPKMVEEEEEEAAEGEEEMAEPEVIGEKSDEEEGEEGEKE
ncbi:MAG: 50S ribosomal protein L25 [Candidatus Sumerlaeia bacterium]